MSECDKIDDQLYTHIRNLAILDAPEFAAQKIFQKFIDYAKCLSTIPEITQKSNLWAKNKGNIWIELLNDGYTYQLISLEFEYTKSIMHITSRNEFTGKLKEQAYDIKDLDEDLIKKIYKEIILD